MSVFFLPSLLTINLLFPLLLGAWCLVSLIRGLVRPRRFGVRNACGYCGQEVAKIASVRCPECGRAYADAGMVTPYVVARLRATTGWLLVQWSVLCFMGALVAMSVVFWVTWPSQVASSVPLIIDLVPARSDAGYTIAADGTQDANGFGMAAGGGCTIVITTDAGGTSTTDVDLFDRSWATPDGAEYGVTFDEVAARLAFERAGLDVSSALVRSEAAALASHIARASSEPWRYGPGMPFYSAVSLDRLRIERAEPGDWKFNAMITSTEFGDIASIDATITGEGDAREGTIQIKPAGAVGQAGVIIDAATGAWTEDSPLENPPFGGTFDADAVTQLGFLFGMGEGEAIELARLVTLAIEDTDSLLTDIDNGNLLLDRTRANATGWGGPIVASGGLTPVVMVAITGLSVLVWIGGVALIVHRRRRMLTIPIVMPDAA